MHTQMIRADPLKTQDHTLDSYTKRFQSVDFKAVGAHRNLHQQQDFREK